MIVNKGAVMSFSIEPVGKFADLPCLNFGYGRIANGGYIRIEKIKEQEFVTAYQEFSQIDAGLKVGDSAAKADKKPLIYFRFANVESLNIVIESLKETRKVLCEAIITHDAEQQAKKKAKADREQSKTGDPYAKLIEFIVEKHCKSKSVAKRLVTQGAIKINNTVVYGDEIPSLAKGDTVFVGKKKEYVVD